jgi:serine/threonine protein kinase
MSVRPGETIGRYQILGPLGSGGMATVYKAFHPALDRTVALKIIRTSLTDDTEFLDRFRQEAKAVARLRHPNIVQVFDFGLADGQHFIVMEYLEGGTLKQRLRSLQQDAQRIPRRELLRIVSEVAEGLAYAHQFGILHRDVKPANVLLTRDGRAVLTDFGIARMVMSVELTRTGVGVGTPEYMSPEQARGEGADERADIYSLGVMAYEMVAGRVPFTADTPLAVVLKHLNDALPPPSSIDPEVGENTDRVLMKALATSR